MTDEQIHAVEQAAVRPDQRLAVVLAAIHAAKPGAIRDLTLDDLDIPNRRITIAGNEQRLSEVAYRILLTGLTTDEQGGRTPPTGTS
jgi:hypothetical protein